jgi:hypothetical protein
MALDGFTIGNSAPTPKPSGSSPSPAPAQPAQTGGALSGFTIGAKATAPKTATSTPKGPVVPAAVSPLDTASLFSKTLSKLGATKTSNSTPATAAEANAYVAPKGSMNFPATAEGTETIKQVAKDNPLQTIKVPGLDVGVSVPKANPDLGGLGGGNAVYDQFKSFVEAPEKGVRSLTELVSATKPDSETRQGKYVIPSYAEIASKRISAAIDDGATPLEQLFTIGTSFGDVANDALMYQGFLSSGVRALAAKTAPSAESQVIAWDALGRPKTLSEAEANWRNVQKKYHPDIAGENEISKQANNAISIIREKGIPNTSIIKDGINRIIDRPLKDLFKKGDIPVGHAPETPIRKFIESESRSASAEDTLIKETKEYVDTHGPDVTRQAMMDNLGFSAPTADRVIARAASTRTAKEIGEISQEILGGVAPEAAAETSKALQGFTMAEPEVTAPTSKTAPKQPVVKDKYAQIKDRLDQRVKEVKARGTAFDLKQAHGESMEHSAYLRKLRGKPTHIETLNAVKYLEGARIGKTVKFEGKSGVVTSAPAYGRVKIQFKDGTEKSIFVKELTQPKVTVDQAIKHLKTEAEKEALARIKMFDDKFKVKNPGKEKVSAPEVKVEESVQPEIPPEPAVIEETPKTEEIKSPDETSTATIADTQIPIKMPTSTKEVGTPKLADRIQERLGETFEDVPQYEKMNMKEEAATAAKMIVDDYPRLKRIAMSLEAAPEGLHAGTAFKAIELKAIQDGDKQTLLELATSKTVNQASLYGQEIKAFDGRDPNSPVDAIASLAEVRVQAAEKRLPKGKTIKQEKEKIVGELKSQVKKTATKETWENFVDSLVC